MGEYFHMVCHRCRTYLSPSCSKLREIEANQAVAAEVGRFCTRHPGHSLELVGDEYNPGDFYERCGEYEQEKDERD